MFKLKNLAALVEEMLQSTTDDYRFYVVPIIGDYLSQMPFAEPGDVKESRKPIINVSLFQLPSSLIPIQGLNNFYITLSMRVMAKEVYAQDISDALGRFIETFNGSAGELDEFAYVVGMDSVTSGDVAQRPRVGSSVEFSTALYFQMIKGGVLSNNCKIKINGEEIIYTSASFPRVRVPQSSSILNDTEMRAYITEQNITFSIVCPYVESQVMKGLTKDIFVGGLATTYKLEYMDEVTPGAPFVYDVVLVSAVLDLEPLRVARQEFVFALARTDVYETKAQEG